jgi:NADP-reducing hydrogenase subunit HndD
MKISTFKEKSMQEVVCATCGQCVIHCPTGALTERNYIEEVWEAIGNPNTHVVVQTAPAVRVGLGEEFQTDDNDRVTGKMVAALRRLGFDAVMDTDFTIYPPVNHHNKCLVHLQKPITLKIAR